MVPPAVPISTYVIMQASSVVSYFMLVSEYGIPSLKFRPLSMLPHWVGLRLPNLLCLLLLQVLLCILRIKKV